MKNRETGDYFEYLLITTILKRKEGDVIPYNNYTKDKFLKLSCRFSHKEQGEIFIGKIHQGLLKIFDNNEIIEQYEFLQDVRGRYGESADIILYTNLRMLKISCKCNNLSIKHQRPSNLHEQLNLSKNDSYVYGEAYGIINDKCYNVIKDEGVFRNLSKEVKYHIYSLFNELVRIFLMKISSSQLYKFLDYIISPGRDKYIFHANTKNGKLTIIKLQYIDYSVKIIKIVRNSLVIELDKGIKVEMRLHTASSTITKKLSLKYDTTIRNILNLYPTLSF